jgi:NADH:flavin oxidoreductase / NADH oxidase family
LTPSQVVVFATHNPSYKQICLMSLGWPMPAEAAVGAIVRVQLGETNSMPTLFDPLKIGDLKLRNRIVMAPLTRNRSTGPGRVPNAMMRDYYAQRASAGLILSEATSVAPGGRIFLQLWHVGRISDPSYHDGALPVGPSAIAPKGNVSLLRPQRPYVAPRALKTEELADIVEAYRHGAQNAKKAGFDGVEIHGANGYLLDQFLQDGSNKRDDGYGGSVENRARLMLEVTDAVLSVWGREGSACTSPRAPTRMTWATAICQRHSAMSRASSASGKSPSSAPANRPRPRGSAPSSRRRSGASISRTRASAVRRPRR